MSKASTDEEQHLQRHRATPLVASQSAWTEHDHSHNELEVRSSAAAAAAAAKPEADNDASCAASHARGSTQALASSLYCQNSDESVTFADDEDCLTEIEDDNSDDEDNKISTEDIERDGKEKKDLTPGAAAKCKGKY